MKPESSSVCFTVHSDLDNRVYISNNRHTHGYKYIYVYTEPANIKWNLFNKRTKYSNFPGDGTMMHLKGLASV